MDSDPYAPPADAASAHEAAMQNHGDVSPDDLRCPAVVVNMRILYTALGLLLLWLAWRAGGRLEVVLLAGFFFVPPLFSVLLPGRGFIFSDRSRRWHRVGKYRRTSAAGLE